jgi:probable F420-dependent oxidoreductase
MDRARVVGDITNRAEIGMLVTGMGFRNPELLADMARTVDHISKGRLILGLGAGWYPKDYEVYGYEFGTVGSRIDQFVVGRVKRRLGQLIPAPVRGIPILIGGAGERKTLPLVGRHADIWHSFLNVETFRQKNDLVNQHAQNAGRDPAAIERSVGSPVWMPTPSPRRESPCSPPRSTRPTKVTTSRSSKSCWRGADSASYCRVQG